jgi:hypothetical protein
MAAPRTPPCSVDRGGVCHIRVGSADLSRGRLVRSRSAVSAGWWFLTGLCLRWSCHIFLAWSRTVEIRKRRVRHSNPTCEHRFPRRKTAFASADGQAGRTQSHAFHRLQKELQCLQPSPTASSSLRLKRFRCVSRLRPPLPRPSARTAVLIERRRRLPRVDPVGLRRDIDSVVDPSL